MPAPAVTGQLAGGAPGGAVAAAVFFVVFLRLFGLISPSTHQSLPTVTGTSVLKP